MVQRAELGNSVPLATYLRDHGSTVRSQRHPTIARHFIDTGGIVFLAQRKRRQFAVIPDIMDGHLDDMTAFVKTVDKPRTEEEVALYREKILRIKDGRKGYEPITITVAGEKIYWQAFRTLNGRWNEFSEAIVAKLASDSVTRAMPYLTGMEGNFDSLDPFLRNALFRIVKNLVIDHLREGTGVKTRKKEAVKKIPAEEHPVFDRKLDFLHQLGISHSPEEVRERANYLLNTQDHTLFFLRFFAGHSWEEIATILGVDHTHINALKTHYSRIVDRLFPDRKKHTHLK